MNIKCLSNVFQNKTCSGLYFTSLNSWHVNQKPNSEIFLSLLVLDELEYFQDPGRVPRQQSDSRKLTFLFESRRNSRHWHDGIWSGGVIIILQRTWTKCQFRTKLSSLKQGKSETKCHSIRPKQWRPFWDAPKSASRRQERAIKHVVLIMSECHMLWLRHSCVYGRQFAL